MTSAKRRRCRARLAASSDRSWRCRRSGALPSKRRRSHSPLCSCRRRGLRSFLSGRVLCLGRRRRLRAGVAAKARRRRVRRPNASLDSGACSAEPPRARLRLARVVRADVCRGRVREGVSFGPRCAFARAARGVGAWAGSCDMSRRQSRPKKQGERGRCEVPGRRPPSGRECETRRRRAYARLPPPRLKPGLRQRLSNGAQSPALRPGSSRPGDARARSPSPDLGARPRGRACRVVREALP
jgi:hypothetical protein